ncbi:MAG: patatin-like phospholipase family protein [Candidatus Obscuribacterales bacterium]|nr:patatin-like phospholipase family protein [Candidatus Obscuribacterales bacterium]
MTTKNSFVARSPVPQLAKDNLHLVCGSGGSRAILASAGAIYALHKAGLDNWKTIGGISGGSLPSLLLASGEKPGDMVRLAIDIDFSSMLTRRTNVFMTFMAFLLKERLAQSRPRKAVLGSEKLRDFLDGRITEWPEKYWTMAVAGRTQIVFTAKGVFQYLHDGTMRQLSDKPAPLGDAVRASCAIPGIIEPVLWTNPRNGEGIYLFDGALSWDGQCPIGVVVRDFGAKPNEVVGCDVGDRHFGGFSGFVSKFWRFFCGQGCVWPDDETDPAFWAAQGSLVVYPELNKFNSLQFTLTAEQKWDAVIESYFATVVRLWKIGRIDNAKFQELSELARNPQLFKLDCANG